LSELSSCRDDTSKEMAGTRRRPAAPSGPWRPAAAVALCAAAGSPVWGAVFLDTQGAGKSWTAWLVETTAAILIASFFFEPMVRHLRAGRLPALVHPRFRSAKAALQWMLAIIIAGLLAEAYRDGIFKSFDSISEWGATSLIVGLMTYAWLRAIDTPYVEASNRAEWLGALGALGFTFIGIVVDVYRARPDDFVTELATWIDRSVMQWAIRLVLWGLIGRLGVWIVTRSSPAGVVPRLMLAALAAGGLLEALVAVSLQFSSMATVWFNTTPGVVLLLYPFVTVAWCAGIWLVTPRNVPPPPVSLADQAARPRVTHRMRLAILCAAVTVVALGARALASPQIAYRDPRIAFFASDEASPDPYGFHNMLTPWLPRAAGANRYVHAVVSVSHAPGQRSARFTMTCKLATPARNSLVETRQLGLELPNAEARRGKFPKTSWIVSFGGPDHRWQPGSYRVECELPRDVVSGDFTLR